MGLAAVAGAAFVAGWLVNATATSSLAAPQEGRERPRAAGAQDSGAPGEMDAMMEAMMQASTPGPHHELLDVFVGAFEGTATIWMAPDATPVVSPARVTREWVLDGRYVAEHVEGEMEQGTFRGLGYLGYSNIDGQYQSVWMENMSTALMVEHGVYDAERKTFMFFGNHRMPGGTLRVTSAEVNVSNPDRHVMTAWSIGTDGRRYKAFEGVFERVQP
jgi:hypothetical protein